MGKALETVKNKDLEILQGEGELSEAEAFFVAAILEEKESDIRLLKGMLWNKCKHGTREKLCEKYDWKYQSMHRYGTFASEMEKIQLSSRISFSQWSTAREAGVTKDDRPALLEEAVEKGWDNRQIREEAEKLKTEKPPLVQPKNQQVYQGTGDAERGRQYREEIRNGQTTRPVTKVSMTRGEAFAIFGLDKGYWISKDSLNVLFKYYSKSAHPDAGGSTDAMSLLNEANELLKGIAR